MGQLIQALAVKLQMSGERLIVLLIGYMGVAVLATFSLAAFAYASAIALDAAYGPVVAASVLGTVSALLALLTIAYLSLRRRRRRREAVRLRVGQPGMTGLATTLLPEMLRASPIGTLVAVAAAAYVLQRSNQGRGRR